MVVNNTRKNTKKYSITKKKKGRPLGSNVLLRPYTFQLYYTVNNLVLDQSHYPSVKDFTNFQTKIHKLCSLCKKYILIDLNNISSSCLKIYHPLLITNPLIINRIPKKSNIRTLLRINRKKNLVKKLLNNDFFVSIDSNTYSSNIEKKIKKQIELKDKYRDLLKTDLTISTRTIGIQEKYKDNHLNAKFLFIILQLILLIYSKCFPKLNVLFYQKSIESAPLFMKKFEVQIEKYLLQKKIRIQNLLTK